MAGEWLGDSWAVPKLERVVGEVGESSGGEFRRAGENDPEFLNLGIFRG